MFLRNLFQGAKPNFRHDPWINNSSDAPFRNIYHQDVDKMKKPEVTRAAQMTSISRKRRGTSQHTVFPTAKRPEVPKNGIHYPIWRDFGPTYIVPPPLPLTRSKSEQVTFLNVDKRKTTQRPLVDIQGLQVLPGKPNNGIRLLEKSRQGTRQGQELRKTTVCVFAPSTRRHLRRTVSIYD